MRRGREKCEVSIELKGLCADKCIQFKVERFEHELFPNQPADFLLHPSCRWKAFGTNLEFSEFVRSTIRQFNCQPQVKTTRMTPRI